MLLLSTAVFIVCIHSFSNNNIPTNQQRTHCKSHATFNRRGIDIDAGCGQLKAAVKKKEDRQEQQAAMLIPGNGSLPVVGVYEDEEQVEDEDETSSNEDNVIDLSHGSFV